MVLTIISDTDYEFFEVRTKDKKLSGYPKASMNRWGTGYYVTIDGKHWLKDLEDVADWVKYEFGEECVFEVD